MCRYIVVHLNNKVFLLIFHIGMNKFQFPLSAERQDGGGKGSNRI